MCVLQRVQIPDEEDHPARQAGSLIGRRQEFKIVFKREVKAWTLLGEYCGVSETGSATLAGLLLPTALKTDGAMHGFRVWTLMHKHCRVSPAVGHVVVKSVRTL